MKKSLSLYSGIVFQYLRRHKILALVFVLSLIFLSYQAITVFGSSDEETLYVISPVGTGTIMTTVSGTGQVSASRQISLMAKTSGPVVYLGAKSGERVKAGTLLIKIDSRESEIALENARLAYQRVLQSVDDLSLTQAKNSLLSAEEAKLKTIGELSKSYDDGFSATASAFIDLPIIFSGLDSIFNDYNNSPYFSENNLNNDTVREYREIALKSYWTARRAYDLNLNQYQKIDRLSASSSVELIIKETYQTSQLLAQALKDTNTAITFLVDNLDSRYRTNAMTADLNNLATWINKTNSLLLSLNSVDQTIKSATTAILSAERALTEKTLVWRDLSAGPDRFDLASQRLNLRQKEYAYQDYFIYAPGDGLVQIDLGVGDWASGVVGTFITDKKMATISLNEVDIAEVKIGQKAKITFDALDDLTVTGEVSELDVVGTVSQGVVSYNAKITFDLDDVRIKSGMSVSADIITMSKDNVLLVPSQAIKTERGRSYIESFGEDVPVSSRAGVSVANREPEKIWVRLGLSNDTETEILAGLNLGQKIIAGSRQAKVGAQTINSTNNLNNLLQPNRQGGNRTRPAGL